MKFPDLEDERLAEFIGILLGDGSVSIYQLGKDKKPYYRLKISFHSKDVEYIEYVKQLIIGLFEIEPIIKTRKNEQNTNIFVFRRKIINFLFEVGLVKSPKWNRALIPEKYRNGDLALKVLRGYFDTDGSVVLTNNNGYLYPRLEFKISPSPMQEQLIDIVRNIGLNFGVYNIGKGKVRVQLNGRKQLRKWIEIIGFSNFKHILRSNIAGVGFEPTTFGL